MPKPNDNHLELTSQFQLAAGHLVTVEKSKCLHRYGDSVC